MAEGKTKEWKTRSAGGAVSDNCCCAPGLFDLDLIAYVVQLVLLGAFIALFGVSFLPAPEYVSGPHPVILDSQGTRVLSEPREKAYYLGAVLVGAGCAVIGLLHSANAFVGVPPGIHGAILGVQVPLANFLMGQSLNAVDGYWYASCGVLASVISISVLGRLAVRSRLKLGRGDSRS